jgi:hypothetical protein
LTLFLFLLFGTDRAAVRSRLDHEAEALAGLTRSNAIFAGDQPALRRRTWLHSFTTWVEMVGRESSNCRARRRLGSSSPSA